MAGYEVSRAGLDAKSAESVIAVREAFRKVRNVKSALDNIKSDAPDPFNADKTVDSLTLEPFNYTPDEAYLFRVLFDNLSGLPVQELLDTGRKLTGLE